MDDKYFNTACFQTAIVLCCQGFKVDHLDRSNPQRVKFCFQKGANLEEAAQSYIRGDEIKLDPRLLFLHQKILKSRLFNEQ